MFSRRPTSPSQVGDKQAAVPQSTHRGAEVPLVCCPLNAVESFLAPWFVCLRCVVPGPWCVGPACASGVWSYRLVLLAGLALWPRRPGPSPSGGLLPGPLVGSGRLALSSGVFLALFFFLFERGDDPGHRPKDRLFRRRGDDPRTDFFAGISPFGSYSILWPWYWWDWPVHPLLRIPSPSVFFSCSIFFQSVLAF